MLDLIHHAVTIPSAKGAPKPAGKPTNMAEDAPTSPSPENPWMCTYPCTIEGHAHRVQLLWDGSGFSLTEFDAQDPTFGEVAFAYNPPLTRAVSA